MATSALSCSCGLLLTLLLAVPAATEDRVRVTPTLIDCYPATTNGSSANATAFRANVASLPSAAAPTCLASLRSAGPDRAFARGVCFGDAAPPHCLACLSVAAKNLTDGCGATTRRARVWSGGCSVSYADTTDC